MKRTFSLLLFVCTTAGSFGQGYLQLTFDGPPIQPPGTAYAATNYSESGMSFRPPPGKSSFVRMGPNAGPGWPDNGTTFVQDWLMFSFTNGSKFDLISVDLAGYSSVIPDVTAQFVGYRADGSTVTTNVDSNGLTFQTFFFGQEFTNLTRVEIPYFGSLDNLVVDPLPIIPPPPALTIEQFWSSPVQLPRRLQVRLLWPTNAGNHQLLTSTNIAATNWSIVSPPAVIVGTNNVVTNDVVGQRRFYRLSGQ